jgi:hypothetical protein
MKVMEDLLMEWYYSLRMSGKCRPGSSTWEIYRRWIEDFVRTTGVGLDELLNLAKEGKLKPVLAQYVLNLEERKLSVNTRAQAISAIKSFLSHHNIYVKFPVATEEPLPKAPVDPDSIRKLLMELTKRKSVLTAITTAFVMVAKDSGLSTATLLSLTWEGGEPYHTPVRVQLAQEAVPIHVRVRRGKTGVVHDSFIGPEGIWGLRYLLENLQMSPQEASGAIFPVDRKLIYMTMYRYSSKAGRVITPKDLRKFFITRMKMARTELHPAAWDVMVEHMAEHAVGRVQRAYFLISPEVLKKYYMESYDAIRVGYP